MAENYGGSHWRVIYPRRQLPKAPETKPKKWQLPLKKLAIVAGAIVIILIIVGLSRPVPSPLPVSSFNLAPSSGNVALVAPSYGQAAIGAEGYGILATHGPKTPVPMASVAKVITALAVLKQKPLTVGQQGPKITISQEDLNYYNDYFSKGGSIVPIQLGEQITEYQALQAILIPSANNFADTLARWAFGSPQKYINYANGFVKSLGMGNTTLADASGLAAGSTSTAEDLIALGQAALSQPVITDISKQAKATLPVAGEVENTNWLIGTNGIIGIKTGNTDEAGGCFLFAAKANIENQPLTIVGAVLGAPSLTTAMNDSTALLSSAEKGFKMTKVISAGQTVGRYDLPWGGSAPIVAQKDLSMFVWQQATLENSINFKKVDTPAPKGTVVGSLTFKNNDKTEKVQLVLGKPLNGPSLTWRLFR